MKWISRVLLLLLYSVPYVFLAIYGDAQWRSLWLYLPMIVGFTVLAIIAHVTKNEVIVIVGNVLSVISSYTALAVSGIGAMSWYFKPVTTHILIGLLSAVAMGAQFPTAIVRINKRRTMRKRTSLNPRPNPYAKEMEKTLYLNSVPGMVKSILNAENEEGGRTVYKKGEEW